MTSGVLETDSGLRRETSRVSFLMCPFCVRHLYPRQTTLDTNLRTPASQAGATRDIERIYAGSMPPSVWH